MKWVVPLFHYTDSKKGKTESKQRPVAPNSCINIQRVFTYIHSTPFDSFYSLREMLSSIKDRRILGKG